VSLDNVSVTTPAVRWRATPDRRDLHHNAIHVWRVPLDKSAGEVDALEKLLTPDEDERRERYRFEVDRRRFAISRGTLRLVLGSYLDANPRDLRFQVGDHGKPSLMSHSAEISFNVSRSADLALIAVSRKRELGVDVEYMRGFESQTSVAEQLFAPSEAQAIRSMPPASREAAFYACWSRKEAYVKARGAGLSFELDRFEVSVGPDEAPALLRVRDEPSEPARWRMVDLRPAPGCMAALVAENGDWRLDCFEWS
jgi:4'-phosphopantetheinyl transferase